jgi:bla regulator protein blaR1
MSGILESLNQFSAAALAAVVNSLWQAIAVAAAAWIVMKLTRMNAATRHILWWAVLAMIVLLPVAPRIQRALSTRISAPGETIRNADAAPADAAVAAPRIEAPVPTSRPESPMQVRGGAWPSYILALWAAALLLQFVRVSWSYRYLQGVQRRAHRADRELRANFDAWMMSCKVRRPTRLLVSREIRSPMAVGFRQPAVILPERLIGEFQESELDHVLLHELAHVARRDDWTNLAARLAGGFVALHPAAVWALSRIDHEREVACDDWVVSMTGSARPYAASLARLFELCFTRRPMLLASGMAESSSHLGKRIELLMQRSREFAPRASVTLVVLGSVVLAVLVIAGAQVPGWFAFAQERAPEPPPLAAQAPVPPEPAPTPQPAAVAAPRALPAPAVAVDQPAPGQPAMALPAPAIAADYETVLSKLRRQIVELRSTYTPNHPRMRALQEQIAALEMRVQQAAPQASVPERGSFLAALRAAGYGDLSVDQIIELKNAGVSAEFLNGISEAGWGKLSPGELIGLTQRGVSPDYVRKMKTAGLKNLTLQDVMSLRSVGAKPEYIQEIHALGFGPYSTAQVIQFSQLGVRPELFRALKEAGFGNSTPNDIVEAASMGVNARDLREAKQYGSNLTLKQIVKLKMAGVL